MDRNIKVLIAEDETVILQQLIMLVSRMGPPFELVATASDGQQALKYIQEYYPDLILCDIRMPYINGLDLIRQVRENNNHAHFVILSGYSEFECARQALKLDVKQ